MKYSLSINTKYFTNPLLLYAISFIAVLFSFSLKWSTYYTNLSSNVLWFIIISSIIALIFAKRKKLRRVNIFRKIPESHNNRKIWFGIVVGYIIEFLYCRTIPFLYVVVGGIGGYRDFEGIPMFHVLLSNASIFWAIYVYIQYRSHPESKKLKRYVFLSFLPHIVLLNRGAFIQILFCDIFIYLLSIKILTRKRILFFISGSFVFLMLFGLMGDVRDANSQIDDNYILRIGGASDEFIESNVPKSLYWGYLYTASPIGNFQEAVNVSHPQYTFDSFIQLVIENFTPDFVAKRLMEIYPEFLIIDRDQYYVTPIFNAPTVFFMPFIRLGWLGVYLTFLFMLFIIFSYISLVPVTSKYFLVGWAVLDTTIILNTFNNMWYFGGLSLLLLTVILIYSNRLYLKWKHAVMSH